MKTTTFVYPRFQISNSIISGYINCFWKQMPVKTYQIIIKFKCSTFNIH